ncbi:IclR family transcriptional regulator [Halegenticoccus tardaugens]|uniref:IclR family transcriptional regulator n=1 Tax=Halegenticoccus tardaugens TaxID=2071624 RepID=UPI00100A8D77|nr:IclR family transcriptional regulator [Halegenticoccus tardaugens]
MSDTSPYAVEATGTSIAILEALIEIGEPLGVTTLADRVGVSKSVAHNHLSTLRTHGYVIKRGRQYGPSLRALKLGKHARENLAVYRAAKRELDSLAAATGETATLFIIEEHSGVPAYVTNPEDGWSPPFLEGERMPLHVNAPGKALLASLSGEQLEAVLDATDRVMFTNATITDLDELTAQLRQIRDDGISFCKEEHSEGIVGVAAPIPSSNGTRTAAAGVCGPMDRLNGRYLEEDIVGQVLSATKAVHATLSELSHPTRSLSLAR